MSKKSSNDQIDSSNEQRNSLNDQKNSSNEQKIVKWAKINSSNE